jgi:hypothetical protein
MKFCLCAAKVLPQFLYKLSCEKRQPSRKLEQKCGFEDIAMPEKDNNSYRREETNYGESYEPPENMGDWAKSGKQGGNKPSLYGKPDDADLEALEEQRNRFYGEADLAADVASELAPFANARNEGAESVEAEPLGDELGDWELDDDSDDAPQVTDG